MNKECKPQRQCFMTGGECVKPCVEFVDQDSRGKVFVLMSFKQPYLDYYKFAIKEVYALKNKECKYAAESTFMMGEYIICKICEEIQKADLVIADLSEKNPNVYYELGLAHALKKKTITISGAKN